MAHQVLARKYRPQRFSDVAGQQHVTVTLMNALSQGRIAHGYVFSGHRGIGKTTIARILAMALNCRNAIGTELRPSAEPCEVCESCTEIRVGNAVDVIEIDAATNRGIDEIRELRDAARYQPARDRYKIYILDEAHQITDAAFNALLKTLEEPPEHIVFMMATTQPEDIPQTVRSRCQHFSFHAVKMADILNELRGIAEQEGVAADDTTLNLLAEAGDGSMRDALSIMDQAIASAASENGRPRLDAAQIRELMGSVSNAVFERLLHAVDQGQSAEVITIASDLLDAGNSPQQLARQCVRYLRNCLMAKISGLTPEKVESDGASNELLQTSPDEQRRVGRTAERFSEEELTRFLQVMLRTFDELGYRQEPRFHFELGLLKLVHLRRLLPMEEVMSRLPSTPDRVLGGVTSGTTAQSGLGSTSSAVTDRSASSRVVESASATAKAIFSPLQQNAARWEHRAPGPVLASKAAVEMERSRAEPLPAAEPLEVAVKADLAQQASMLEEVPQATKISDAQRSLSEAGVGASTPVAEFIRDNSESADEDATNFVRVLKEAAALLLNRAKSQGSAADAIEDAEWTVGEGTLRIQTALSSTMLPLVINPEAEKIVRAAIRDKGAGSLMIELLPGKPSVEGQAKRIRGARSGSAQAKAEQHPIVQQAQKLFHAEIRKVIDLTEGK